MAHRCGEAVLGRIDGGLNRPVNAIVDSLHGVDISFNNAWTVGKDSYKRFLHLQQLAARCLFTLDTDREFRFSMISEQLPHHPSPDVYRPNWELLEAIGIEIPSNHGFVDVAD